MKILNKSLIFTVLMGISSPAVLANQCPANLLKLPSAQSFEIGNSKDSALSYYELCLNSLFFLKSEMTVAKDEWRMGSPKSAVDRIYNALEVSVRDVLSSYSDVSPYTADTLINAYNIANVLKASTDKNIKNNRLKLQVQFLTLIKLVELAEWSYQNVDNIYYEDSLDSYFGMSFLSFDFPADYFKNVKKLSLKYLDILQELDSALADNKVELDVTYAFVHGTRTILANNIYNREFCSSKSYAQNILSLIKRFRCNSIKVPNRRKVDVIRTEINKLKDSIRSVRLNDRQC